MARISVSLPDDLADELARVARDDGTTPDELVGEAVERLIQARHAAQGLPIPPYARRLGPLIDTGEEDGAGDEPPVPST